MNDTPLPDENPAGVTQKSGLPPIAPDLIEEERGNEIDEIAPARGGR